MCKIISIGVYQYISIYLSAWTSSALHRLGLDNLVLTDPSLVPSHTLSKNPSIYCPAIASTPAFFLPHYQPLPHIDTDSGTTPSESTMVSTPSPQIKPEPITYPSLDNAGPSTPPKRRTSTGINAIPETPPSPPSPRVKTFAFDPSETFKFPLPSSHEPKRNPLTQPNKPPSPHCQSCDASGPDLQSHITKPTNEKGNEGRPYLTCRLCDTFVTFTEARGIIATNPLCDCGVPSRLLNSGAEKGWIGFHRCAGGACGFWARAKEDFSEDWVGRFQEMCI